MKKITLLIVLLLTVGLGFGQTTLAAGDIAITGVNSDNSDQFSFVLLSDVTVGTIINFTDFGWVSSGSFINSVNEGVVSWTASSDLNCGTEIVILDTGSNNYSATFGTAAESDSGFSLATGGDQLIAYQGTLGSPSILYGIQFGSATGWTNAVDTNTSAVPTGLTDGTDAIYIGNSDNGNYDCSTTSGQSAILASVSASINWNGSNSRLGNLGGCYYSCAPCSGGTVTWNAGWSGTPSLSTQVIIETDYNTGSGINGEVSFRACSVKVNSGISLNIDNDTFVQVENDLIVESGGAITVQPYGAFVQNDDLSHVINNGTITVTKKTSELNKWYEYTYWSSPVSGETVGNALFTSDASRRYIFNGENFLDSYTETSNNNIPILGHDDIDDDGNDWQWVGGSTTMQPGIGYAATHSEAFFIGPPMGLPPYRFDYPFIGDFNNGVYNVPIYRNDFDTNDNNWNLIGNPYPSAIDADLFLLANTSIDASTGTDYTLDGAIFLWSQATEPSPIANGNQGSNFSDSDFAIINGSGVIAGGDGVPPSRYIPSGQAFFVTYSQAATPISTSVNGDGHSIAQGEVIFNNSMRVASTSANSQFFKKSNSKGNATPNKLWINLTTDQGAFNQTAVAYIDGATNNFDGAYFDAPKPAGIVTAAILYTNIEGSDKKLAIQGKAANSINEDEIISLGFKTNTDEVTLLTISIDHVEGSFLSNNTIYLKDNLLNKLHNLTDADYTFTSEVGEFNQRFEIVFNANALSVNDITADTNALKIVELQDNRVQFSISNGLRIENIKIYDLLGRQLYNLNGSRSVEVFNLSNLNHTVYIAKVQLSNGALITKKAIKR